MALAEYRKKRNFKKTSEPQGGRARAKPIFVVQEHWASHLHYDFRLEAFGVLKSWAVPKGPSTKVGDKRLAVEVEDHPIDYAKFHGTIPEGEYGAGKVKIWDRGHWTPPKALKEALASGHLEFELKGKKLKGRWLLTRTKKSSGRKSQWFLIKRHDEGTSSDSKKALGVVIPNKAKSSAPMPKEVSPQLALLVDQVPKGDRYLHEIKWDGYRTLAFIKGKSVELRTRNGHDWTEKYEPLDAEFKKLKIKSAVIDGEIVSLDSAGKSDFSALQAAIKDQDMSSVVFYAFDLLYVNGQDLRDETLEIRKQILKKILSAQPRSGQKILYSEHVRGQGDELMKKAEAQGLEGIIAKDRLQSYSSGRSASWQKIKTSQRQEFVIGGYTDPQGARTGLGALLMGVYENKKLKYIGKVGTGFNEKNLSELIRRLEKMETSKSPFEIAPPPRSSKTHWVKPVLVAEIEFKAWTADGNLRHAFFQGLREDKSARQVVGEKPVHLKSVSRSSGSASRSSGHGNFRLTHPDRVVYPKTDTKKIDVANYYKSVAPWILPHISKRPLSLLRCPDHAGADCFFQKHVDNSKLTAVGEAVIRDQKVVYIDSEEGLLQLVQWGVIEPHPWQCHLKKTEHPDQIIFDLDPDENVSWKEVVKTSFRLKKLLEQLDLRSFLKTTGGKGLHLHVPIEPLYSWEQIKNFAKTVSQKMEEDFPGQYTTNLLKKTRKNKIFIDYLRNGFGATAVAPFALRSKEQPTVAVPVTWEEIKKIGSPASFDLNSTLLRLAHQKKNPWEEYFETRQRIRILKPG